MLLGRDGESEEGPVRATLCPQNQHRCMNMFGHLVAVFGFGLIVVGITALFGGIPAMR